MGFVDDPEKIYPVKAARRLVKVEIEEVDDASDSWPKELFVCFLETAQ